LPLVKEEFYSSQVTPIQSPVPSLTF